MTSKSDGIFKVAAFVVGLCVLAPASRAATLLSENFDELTPQPTVTAVGAFAAVGGTNVDVVGSLNGSFFPSLCTGYASGNCIDLNGTGGNPQGILQSTSAITLNPGTTYTLTFDLIGSQRGPSASATVSFGPYSQTFTLPSTAGLVVAAPITVAATTSALLTFSSNTPGEVGLLLDNVSVTTQTVTSTPEPSTGALVVAGLVGAMLVGAVRRRAG